jgi:hypothetical protein
LVDQMLPRAELVGQRFTALATTDEINHGPSPQKPSCCLPHPPPPLWKLPMTPRMNIFLSAREAASMTGLGTKRTKSDAVNMVSFLPRADISVTESAGASDSAWRSNLLLKRSLLYEADCPSLLRDRNAQTLRQHWA